MSDLVNRSAFNRKRGTIGNYFTVGLRVSGKYGALWGSAFNRKKFPIEVLMGRSAFRSRERADVSGYYVEGAPADFPIEKYRSISIIRNSV
jgi:hypothetical protein